MSRGAMSKGMFVTPNDVTQGDLVWYFDMNILRGPFLVVDYRYAGYGNFSEKRWILYDSRTGDIHQSAITWLRVPMEE